MALPSDYISGTITLTNGSPNFTGTGTGWQAADFREGDILLGVEDHAGQVYVIAAITGQTSGTLTQDWAGTSGTYTYRMRYEWDSSRVSAQARAMVELLGNGNLESIAGLTGPGVVVLEGPHSAGIRPFTDFINGVAYDVQVDTLADRAAYDGQAEGFSVLVSDMGDGRSALFSKASNTSGDWTDAAYITGPVGPEFEVSVGPTTTLPPDQPATVTPVDVPGGVRLDFAIPRGPTGDITGVTTFWNTRLGSDTTAAAARTGLGAASLEANTFTGVQRMPSTSRIFGTAAYLSFENNTSGTRTGFVGNGSGGNNDIYLFSDAANIRLVPASGFNVLASGSRILNLADGTAASDAANVGQIPSIIRANTVGTVSQSGGVPTGAIVGRGGNANGEYVRFADGTQICWGTVSIPGVTTPTGSLFMSASITVTFPAAFVGLVSGAASVYAHGIWAALHDPLPTGAVFRAYCGVSLSASQGGRYIAIGRWF